MIDPVVCSECGRQYVSPKEETKTMSEYHELTEKIINEHYPEDNSTPRKSLKDSCDKAIRGWLADKVVEINTEWRSGRKIDSSHEYITECLGLKPNRVEKLADRLKKIPTNGTRSDAYKDLAEAALKWMDENKEE